MCARSNSLNRTAKAFSSRELLIGVALFLFQNRDEEEYVRLLKKAKNERLLTLLRQTDEYMQKLGAAIKADQDRDGGVHSNERDKAVRYLAIRL